MENNYNNIAMGDNVKVKTKCATKKIIETTYQDIYTKIKRNLSLNRNSTYYELLINNVKPYIDYDEDGFTTEIEMAEKRLKVINDFIESLKNSKYSKFYMFDSSGWIDEKKKFKLSLRVLIQGYYYNSGIEMVEDMKTINSDIDLSVYKTNGKNQLMRLPYCCKENSNRCLKKIDLDAFLQRGEFKTIEFNNIPLKEYKKYFISNTANCVPTEPLFSEDEDPLEDDLLDDDLLEDNLLEDNLLEEPHELNLRIRKVLKNILTAIAEADASYYQDYQKWYEIGFACGGIHKKDGIDCLNEWLEFSANWSDYDEDAEIKAKRIYEEATGEKGLGSLYHILKTLKPHEPHIFSGKNYERFCDDSLNRERMLVMSMFSDEDIAQYFVEVYKDEFLIIDGEIYYFNGIYWEQELPRVIKNKLSGEVYKKLKKVVNIIFIQNKNVEEFTKLINKISALAFVKKLNLYYSRIQDKIEIRADKNPFDLQPHLLGFTNGTFDLEKESFREGRKEDYISRVIPYDYEKCDTDKCLNFINTIMPVEEERDFLLKALATGLYGRTLNNFIVLTGSGRNGKDTLLTFLMKKSLGEDIYYEASATAITQNIKGDLNVSISGMNKMRMIVYNEPNANETIKISTLKQLTGGATFQARGLYQKKADTKIQGSQFMMCNKKPLLDAVDSAIANRLFVIPFRSLFYTTDMMKTLPKDTKYVYEVNPYYQSDEFTEQMKLPFLNILLKYFTKFKQDNYILKGAPKSIIDLGKEYLADSDEIFGWFLTMYERVEFHETHEIDENIPFVAIKDVFKKFKDSEYFQKLSKQKQRRINKKWIIDEFKNNPNLKVFYRDRFRRRINGKIKENRNVMLTWKEIDYENDYESDEE
jgi:phage/plasmid-associated DNA primase